MKTFKKNYIGKGTQVANLSIVKFSFKLSEIVKLTHVFNGEDFLTFEIAKLKSPDSFGHDYTAYVNKMVETTEPQTSQVQDAPQKKIRKPKKLQQTVEAKNIPVMVPTDELPF